MRIQKWPQKISKVIFHELLRLLIFSFQFHRKFSEHYSINEFAKETISKNLKVTWLRIFLLGVEKLTLLTQPNIRAFQSQHLYSYTCYLIYIIFLQWNIEVVFGVKKNIYIWCKFSFKIFKLVPELYLLSIEHHHHQSTISLLIHIKCNFDVLFDWK